MNTCEIFYWQWMYCEGCNFSFDIEFREDEYKQLRWDCPKCGRSDHTVSMSEFNNVPIIYEREE